MNRGRGVPTTDGLIKLPAVKAQRAALVRILYRMGYKSHQIAQALRDVGIPTSTKTVINIVYGGPIHEVHGRSSMKGWSRYGSPARRLRGKIEERLKHLWRQKKLRDSVPPKLRRIAVAFRRWLTNWLFGDGTFDMEAVLRGEEPP